MPLPFDDELKENAEKEMQAVQTEAEEIWKQAEESGYFKKAI